MARETMARPESESTEHRFVGKPMSRPAPASAAPPAVPPPFPFAFRARPRFIISGISRADRC